MKAKRTSKLQRVVSLPPEWDCFIPPSMVNVETVHAGSMVGSQPKWNPQWLAGLEKYIRAIVQDELRQANDKLTDGSANNQ